MLQHSTAQLLLIERINIINNREFEKLFIKILWFNPMDELSCCKTFQFLIGSKFCRDWNLCFLKFLLFSFLYKVIKLNRAKYSELLAVLASRSFRHHQLNLNFSPFLLHFILFSIDCSSTCYYYCRQQQPCLPLFFHPIHFSFPALLKLPRFCDKAMLESFFFAHFSRK